jgi:hypothetical protein
LNSHRTVAAPAASALMTGPCNWLTASVMSTAGRGAVSSRHAGNTTTRMAARATIDERRT